MEIGIGVLSDRRCESTEGLCADSCVNPDVNAWLSQWVLMYHAPYVRVNTHVHICDSVSSFVPVIPISSVKLTFISMRHGMPMTCRVCWIDRKSVV